MKEHIAGSSNPAQLIDQAVFSESNSGSGFAAWNTRKCSDYNPLETSIFLYL